MSGETNMPIQVECTGCGKRYSVADQFAGKRAKCKNCGATLVVPEPATTGAHVDYDAMAAMESSGTVDDTGAIAVAPPPVPAAAPPMATRVVWIPVTAADGGYVQGIKLKAMFGQIKSEDEVAPPSDIKVIVKTNKVKNLQDEAAFARRGDVQGMVVNKIESLSPKERALLQ